MNGENEVTAGTSGWVKLYRDVMDNDVWKDKPFARGQAWVDLIMLANHKDKEFWLNASCLSIQRGQFVTSKRKLGERWGWSISKVTKFLSELQKAGMVTVTSDHKKTMISVTNYSLYQSNSEETVKEQSKNSERTVKEQRENSEETLKENRSNSERNQKETNKKYKNIKEDKKDNNSSPDTVTQSRIVEAWNNAGGVQVRGITPGTKREAAFLCLLSEFTEKEILTAIDNIKASEYLTGQNDNGWKIDFDWFLNPDNFMKVYEGRYGKAKEERAEQKEKSEWQEA